MTTTSNEAAAASGGGDDDDTKCPCCNNPWSKGAADMFSQLCAMCEETKTNDDDEQPPAIIPGLDPTNMDPSVQPSDNFYLHSNGGWIKSNPIPAGYPSWNSFLMLHVQSQERLQAMLQDLEGRKQTVDAGHGKETTKTTTTTTTTKTTTTTLTEDEAKVARFYAAAMDEEAIEEAGIAPLRPLLDLCAATANAAAAADGNNDAACATCTPPPPLATSVGRLLSQFGMAAFFAIGASPDNTNSDHSLCQVYQGGLGLPDRDYYFDDDKEGKRTAYKKHVALMLTLLEDAQAAEPTEANVAAAESIYQLEAQLAEAHMTKTENRDPNATYNPMTVSELTERCGGGGGGGGGGDGGDGGGFDFASYFAAATGGAKSADELGKINVRNTKAIEKMVEVVASADRDVLHQYLRWHAVNKFAAYLSKPFVDADFNFYEKELAGTAEIKPRWKRAMAFTESALGEVLGKLYCAKYFDESSKSQALQIVETVRQALEDRLREVDWMTSDATREEALKKMSRFRVKIGYPDKWIDYTSLKIEEGDSFLSMVFKARVFDHMRDVEEMNAPTDREKWFMTPQTINAYYHPSLNEIVFPAAILQPPFFNPNADDAVNYGAIGAVTGHEMTHGFDDKGRKFNWEGNMKDWWSKEDGEEYEKRVEVMVEQASEFEVHGQKVKGKLTCGENIADLGGLRLAYRALISQPGFDDTKLIDGFTPTQRFFLSWSQAWRQNITKERSLQLITLDPHGPNEMRCNGPLSNIEEFIQAFNISEDSAMYKAKEKRVDIW